jgi:hypothetical protein
MILSSRYKGKLSDFASGFTSQKKDLQFLTTQKTAVNVVEISKNLNTVDAKIDKILAFIEVQSPKEKEVSAMVANDGGEEAVINASLL